MILVPMEVITILMSVAGLMALLVIVFLYIQRKWCFFTSNGFPCVVENTLTSKHVHKASTCKKLKHSIFKQLLISIVHIIYVFVLNIARLGTKGFDTEEDILRRLRKHNKYDLHRNFLPPTYGSHSTQHLYVDTLQQVNVDPSNEVLNDPLGIAERGKVGVPPSSSDCSSNSSMVDAAGDKGHCKMDVIANGHKKGKKLKCNESILFINCFNMFYVCSFQIFMQLPEHEF